MATPTKTQLKVTYTKKRETKNTVVFQNDANEKDSYYVQKSDAVNLGNPERIQLTIEAI
jgi:hypothetical protein